VEKLSVELLSDLHVESVHRLYSVCAASAPLGFLATRSRVDFDDLLADPENTVAVGAWEGDVLVAYSICHQIRRNPYPNVKILGSLEGGSQTIYQGDGTVVRPGYRGRLLMQRLYQMRRRQLENRKVDHSVGLVSIGNVDSLGNVLIAGGLLVGFADDESGENYVGYAGRLAPGLLDGASPVIVRFGDRDRQRELFDGLSPVRSMARTSQPGMDKRSLEFAVKTSSSG
jgi:hypothetical protein